MQQFIVGYVIPTVSEALVEVRPHNFKGRPPKALIATWDSGEKQPESTIHVCEGPEFQQQLVVLEGVIR